MPVPDWNLSEEKTEGKSNTFKQLNTSNELSWALIRAFSINSLSGITLDTWYQPKATFITGDEGWVGCPDCCLACVGDEEGDERCVGDGVFDLAVVLDVEDEVGRVRDDESGRDVDDKILLSVGVVCFNGSTVDGIQ